jgi:hypothetical protein
MAGSYRRHLTTPRPRVSPLRPDPAASRPAWVSWSTSASSARSGSAPPCAFVFGLTYVWLMERSRSLLAPMTAHGLGDMLEVAAVMVLTAAGSSPA